MFKSIAALATLAALATSGVAHAATTTCLTASGMELENLRVTYANWFTVYELETNSSGCVTIPNWGTGPVGITIHATNPVIQMVNWGLPIQENRTVTNGSTQNMGVDFAVAERMRRDYDSGLRSYGPFTGESPLPGNLATGAKISADLGSPLVVSLPYVEPAPAAGLIPPRLHLRSTDTTGSTPHHELAHALHISQLPVWLRLELETYYVGWLFGENNTHNWYSPSTDVVAYVEAFGGVGSTFETIGNGNEADFLVEADSRVSGLREDRSGDMTIEGVVYGVLFHELASSLGLDYVIDTYISCEVLTLDDYATCIHDLEGRSSAEFQALRVAGDVYGVEFSIAPKNGDADYCTTGFPCEIGEGDCDSSTECGAGLTCIWNVGAPYGWSSATDVCELPDGNGNKCTADHPCNRPHTGDCDTDNDCTGSLICAQNTGATYGMASWVDTCEYPVFLSWPIILP